ncbi:GtrA family protein [uncultured Alistipes sp.]|jgi:gtrA-like protein|uniref:GtrA family protein n=1 Tax=uncultured Alistipes sp. TaxID=538949 RepID=UPI0025D9E546|nr:GtrA family protein [uncultured Alistipes sp.]
MRLSEQIIRIIDWFYVPPVAALVSRQTFRYTVCGCVNVVFSWVCYYLVYNFVIDKELVDLGFIAISPHIATLLVIFPFTFLSGFWLNRYVTFRQSPLRTRIQLFRYLLAVAGSVVLNYFCLKLFVDVWGFWATPSQMLATLVTMIYSYLAAKYFTFRNAVNE